MQAEGPRRQVEMGFAAYFRLVISREAEFRLLYGRDHADDKELGLALRTVEDAIAAAIEPLIDAGLDDDHRRLLAYAVVGMAEGASRRFMEQRAGEWRRRVKKKRRGWPNAWPTWPGPACDPFTPTDPSAAFDRQTTEARAARSSFDRAPELGRHRHVDVVVPTGRIEHVVGVGELGVGESERVDPLPSDGGEGGRSPQSAPDGRGLPPLGMLATDVAHVVGLHHDDEIGPDQSPSCTCRLRCRRKSMPSSSGMRESAVRVRMPIGCPSMEWVPAVTMWRGSGRPFRRVLEHEPGHDRARRVAGAEHQELGHRAACRSMAGASRSSVCWAWRVALVRNIRSPRSVRCTTMEATMAIRMPAKVSRR